jgi:hypothetical protein
MMESECVVRGGEDSRCLSEPSNLINDMNIVERRWLIFSLAFPFCRSLSLLLRRLLLLTLAHLLSVINDRPGDGKST